MLEILFFSFLGVLTGVITGLMPGLHPNSIIFFSFPLYFNLDIDFIFYGSFIAGLSISHTFHDFIPSIFLGVPDPASALAALPGQKMALRGRGIEAFEYTVYGGLYSVIACSVFSIILYYSLKPLYNFISPFMEYILLFILLLIVFKSDDEFNSIIVAILSGLLGIIAFNSPANQQYVLTPIFGGLFAAPSLLQGFKASDILPEQLEPELKNIYRKGGLIGFLASIPVIVFPGLSSSISATFLHPVLRSRRQFLAAVGAVNTADIFLSFVTLLAMDRARSGASVAIRSLGQDQAVFLIIGVSLLSAGFSAIISLFMVRAIVSSRILQFQRLLSGFIMVLIISLSVYLTSIIGLLIFLTSAFIGYFAFLNSDRHSCMAVLLVPSILFFMGSGTFM